MVSPSFTLAIDAIFLRISGGNDILLRFIHNSQVNIDFFGGTIYLKGGFRKRYVKIIILNFLQTDMHMDISLNVIPEKITERNIMSFFL